MVFWNDYDALILSALNMDEIIKITSEAESDLQVFVDKGDEVHLPKEREKEFFEFLSKHKLESDRQEPGGSGINSGIGLAKAGRKVKCIGAVGDDPRGKKMIEHIKNNGVEPLVDVTSYSSGICYSFIHPDGERSFVVIPGSNDYITKKSHYGQLIRRAKVFHSTSFLSKNAMYSLTTQVDMANYADEQGKIVSITPTGFYADKIAQSRDAEKENEDEMCDLIEKLLYEKTIVFLNERELHKCTGKSSVREGIGAFINSHDVKIVVATRGAEGSAVGTKDEYHTIGQAQVKDPNNINKVGAGDAYVSGFINRLLEERDLRKCGLEGTYFAECKINSDFGATNYSIDNTKIDEYLVRFS